MQLFRNELLQYEKEKAMDSAMEVKRQSFQMSQWIKLMMTQMILEAVYKNF